MTTILQATLQKSYYGKAHVRQDNHGLTLVSYWTEVARIDGNGDFVRLWDGWSRTTSMHVNDFRIQNGLAPIRKREWDEMPVERRW